MDGEHGAGVAPFAVGVELDVAVGVDRLEVDQLRDERVGDAGIDGGAEVDDPLGEQVRVDVHDPLAARVLGDDVGDRVGAHRLLPMSPPRKPVGTRPPGVAGDQVEHGVAGVPQVVGLQLHVDGRAADAGRALVEQDA